MLAIDSAVGFRNLGSLSAHPFRSVLSHWIFRYELERLYAKKGRPGNPSPADCSFREIFFEISFAYFPLSIEDWSARWVSDADYWRIWKLFRGAIILQGNSRSITRNLILVDPFKPGIAGYPMY